MGARSAAELCQSVFQARGQFACPFKRDLSRLERLASRSMPAAFCRTPRERSFVSVGIATPQRTPAYSLTERGGLSRCSFYLYRGGFPSYHGGEPRQVPRSPGFLGLGQMQSWFSTLPRQQHVRTVRAT